MSFLLDVDSSALPLCLRACIYGSDQMLHALVKKEAKTFHRQKAWEHSVGIRVY